jgi:hypothetical protein
VEGLGGEVEGGWHAHGVKNACDGAKREEGGSLGAPLVAGGTRGKRGMGGVQSAHDHVEEEGGPGHGARSSWGAQTRAVRGRAAAARERRRRVTHGGGRGRERRERAGEAGPQSGSRLLAKERERGREWQVGLGLRLNVFKLVQKCSNLI